MASLELQNNYYRLVFLYRGKKLSYSLKTGNKRQAELLQGAAEKVLWQLDQGLLEPPDDVDIVSFVRLGGKTPQPNRPAALTLQDLEDRYTVALAVAVESNSL